MMRMRNKIYLVFLLLFFTSCTSNPFDDDTKIFGSSNSISGKVILNDNSSVENAYIWLEGFDLGTFPDKDGNFKLILPSPELQPYSGLTGTFKLFSYISNFFIDSVFVVLKNGKILPSHGDIDDNNKLRNAIYLRKKLEIYTTISPDTVPDDYTEGILINLSLRATEDTVFIEYPDRAAGPLSIIFFQQISPDPGFLKIFENSFNAANAPMIADSITDHTQFYSAGFRFTTLSLRQGIYHVIPYFIILRKSVPENLLNDFGVHIDEPNVDFIKLPTNRNGGKFVVTKSAVVH